MMTSKTYAYIDFILQTLIVLPTLVGLTQPIFFLLGLLPLGLVQLLSALSGWLVHRDPLRAIYLGSALAYLAFGFTLCKLLEGTSLPHDLEFGLALLYFLLASVAALGYYLYTWRTLRSLIA